MNTSSNISTPLPLAFRLRLVDRLIARELDAAFAAEGVGRREWRALSIVAGASPVPAGPRGRGGRGFRALAERGWIERGDDGGVTLTDDGAAAKERLDALAEGVHDRATGAIPADDFDTLLRSLDAIARELGWDESQPMPARPGRGGGRRGGRGHHDGHRHGHGFGGHGHGHGFGGHGHGHGFGGHGHGHGHGHGFGGQGHDGRGFGPRFGEHHGTHGRPGRRGGVEAHPAVAEAFERGFVRGYEQAQRD
ncbi:MarR family winged helix-turn-helix transcriptional regulator [Microbacterium sp. 179-B 1A2 NHS]|uniref:MarR family winged helix-turn-helix transcriptional regulator n=1 Tax=Microbacterium sp. 179-B 1A2 NHS TaxID=3142383 RepID=UPI0039A232B0